MSHCCRGWLAAVRGGQGRFCVWSVQILVDLTYLGSSIGEASFFGRLVCHPRRSLKARHGLIVACTGNKRKLCATLLRSPCQSSLEWESPCDSRLFATVGGGSQAPFEAATRVNGRAFSRTGTCEFAGVPCKRLAETLVQHVATTKEALRWRGETKRRAVVRRNASTELATWCCVHWPVVDGRFTLELGDDGALLGAKKVHQALKQAEEHHRETGPGNRELLGNRRG